MKRTFTSAREAVNAKSRFDDIKDEAEIRNFKAEASDTLTNIKSLFDTDLMKIFGDRMKFHRLNSDILYNEICILCQIQFESLKKSRADIIKKFDNKIEQVRNRNKQLHSD